MKARRLVLSTSYPSHSGDTAGHFVQTEVERARADGARVLVVAAGASRPRRHGQTYFLGGSTLFQTPGALARLRDNPLRILVLPLLAIRFLRLVRRWPAFEQIDAHWLIPCGWPGLLFLRGQAEVVVHGSDVRLLLRFPRSLRVLILRQLVRRAARLRFVSRALRRELIDGVTWPDELRAYLESSRILAAALTVPLGLTRSAARETLGLAAHEQLVVLCSRLLPSKRIRTALTAATLLPGTKTIAIGDGSERQELERAFPEVRFLGGLPRQEALTWLAAADVLLHASMLEGAPSVVREARMLGTAVVCSPCGDVPLWAETDGGIWCVETGREASSELSA